MAGKVVQALGSWDTAVTLTTPEDIGRLTAEIFFTEPPIEDRIVYIGGDTITYGQVADLIEAVVGQPITRTVATIDALRQYLQQHPTNFVKKYQVIFGAGRGVAWQPEHTFNVQQGIATTSARQ